MRVKLGITKKQLLAWLRSQVGTKESPAGSNNQPYGRKYGMNRVPWCAILVWCALTLMGKFKTFLKSAYVPDWQTWAIKSGRWHGKSYKAKAGDLIVFQMPGPKRANHIGVVIADRPTGSSNIKTIEGNTGGSNPRAGGMVGAQERTPTYVVGFIDLQNMFVPEPKPQPKKPAAKKPSISPYRVTARGGLNIRASRKIKKTNIVATVKQGTKLDVIGVPSGGWAKVMYKSKERYVASRYLRKVK